MTPICKNLIDEGFSGLDILSFFRMRECAVFMNPVKAYVIALVCTLILSAPVSAFEVQEVTSSKGIKAWLVESHSIPIISMMFSMPGGRNFEEPGKEGSHALMAGMLVEGAGDLTSEEFKAARTRMSSRLSFYTDGDHTSGYLTTLSKNRDATARLLQQSLTRPRFEEKSFERLRDQALQNVAQAAVDQQTIADDTWFALAFPGHIYGRTGRGSATSLKDMTTEDLRKLWTATANRHDLRVAVVGDITPDALKLLLDRTFGDLPDVVTNFSSLETALVKGPVEKRIPYNGPQTIVYFGNPALPGDGQQGWSSNVLAEILGGQASFARLTQALREKTGLTYSVSFTDYSWRYAAIQLGNFATANGTAQQALTVLNQELSGIAANGPTVEELRKVKSYMNGAYALRFSDNDSIASELLYAMQRGNTVSYFKDRPSKVNAVTVEDVKAAAAKLLKPENSVVVIVGKQ
jgi:zinc protease